MKKFLLIMLILSIAYFVRFLASPIPKVEKYISKVISPNGEYIARVSISRGFKGEGYKEIFITKNSIITHIWEIITPKKEGHVASFSGYVKKINMKWITNNSLLVNVDGFLGPCIFTETVYINNDGSIITTDMGERYGNCTSPEAIQSYYNSTDVAK